MENLGYLSVLLAFLLSVYAIVAALAGKRTGNPFIESSAPRAGVAAWGMVSIASGLLLYLILTDDLRLS
jgi:cytochrome c biogenesis factor